ncbi:MAG TPA: hypothetical protein VIV64_04380 [Gammaproteobacteria bacterium]|jgi:hypothetical protein
MSGSSTPPQFEPPSGKTILIGSGVAIVVAVVVLVTVIWPAEYEYDPTGIGRLLGIMGMSTAPTITIEVVDNIGGNESLREVEIPDFGDPVPLPNPDVHQAVDAAPETVTMTVELDVDSETEVKAVLREKQMIVYEWVVDDGIIYSDFHGHTPEFGEEFWVRYQEDQRGSSGESGSLVAPFSGEHGWYWVNLNDHPVTITLTVTGYFDDMIDYSGLF